MRNSILWTIAIVLFSILHLSEMMEPNVDRKIRPSKARAKAFGKKSSNGLISFNSGEQKLNIDWSITIPFISIPLEHKIGKNGEIPPLLNINTKPLGIIGLITTLFSVITPLFSKTHSQTNYRSEDGLQLQWLQTTFDNNYVTPCMQQIICSIVSLATHTQNPTSTDKIIDGLSSYKWLKNFTNGTIIEEAIDMGRKGHRDCAHAYKDCLITPKLLKSMMTEFGVM